MAYTLDRIWKKYSDQMKPLVVPFLVLYIIYQRSKASSLEIKEDLQALVGKELEYELNSYYRLIAKLEHEYELIEPVELVKEKGPARIYYNLTPLGKDFVKKVHTEIISIFQNVKITV